MKFAVNLTLASLFLISSLILVGKWSWIYYVIFPITLGYYLIVPIVFKKQGIRINNKILVIFITLYCYILATSVSSIINEELNLLTSSVMLVLVIVCLTIIFPVISSDNFKSVFVGVGIFHIPIIVIPLLLNGLNTSPYRGIFLNSNSFGITTATLFLIGSIIFFEAFEDSIIKSASLFRNTKVFFWGAILILIELLVIISGSRASFLCTMLIFITGIAFISLSLIRKNRVALLLKGSFKILVLFISAVLLVRITNLWMYLDMYIISKFETFAASGNILSDRNIIWSNSIQQATAFGHGRSYFMNQFNHGAHNTFIAILGNYGWLPLLFFVCFVVTILIASVSYALKSQGKYKLAPILSIVCFLVLSAAENMLYSLSMFVMLALVGNTLTKNLSKSINKSMVS